MARRPRERSIARILPGWAVALWFLAIVPCAGQSWQHSPPELTSLVGERLEFRLKWQGITAADASLEVLDDGEGKIQFRATAKTVGLADLLYPVRSQIRSTVWIAGFRAISYVKDGKEGRGPEEVQEVTFDLEQGLAYRIEDGETREPVEVPVDVRDPFAAFYAFRLSEVDARGLVELTISDGKRTKVGQVRMVGRERVTTPAGTFDTIKIAPDIEGLGGVFRKSPGATLYIWLTDDEWRRPVMMRSKVSVGSFTAKLRSWSHARANPEQAAIASATE